MSFGKWRAFQWSALACSRHKSEWCNYLSNNCSLPLKPWIKDWSKLIKPCWRSEIWKFSDKKTRIFQNLSLIWAIFISLLRKCTSHSMSKCFYQPSLFLRIEPSILWVLALGNRTVKFNFDASAGLRVLTLLLYIYYNQGADFAPRWSKPKSLLDFLKENRVISA